MKFKVTVEKLKKGWNFTLPVASERKGRALILDLHRQDAADGHEGKKLAKLKGVLKKNGSARAVSLYRSKLSDGQAIVKERFIEARREERANA